jgi:orotate phosphoribosyltransferase
MTTELTPAELQRRQLLSLIRTISLQRGQFVLSSGAVSDYYLDLRKATTHPVGAFLAGTFLHQEAQRLKATHVGGPTLGADPIVGATVALSHGSPWPVSGYMVRAAAKTHGTGRQVEGNIEAGAKVIMLDDVVTSAGSLIQAATAVRELGAEIVGAWCLVDRAGGGRERLAEIGLELTAVFEIEEVLSGPESIALPRSFRPRTPYISVDAILELVPGHVLLVRRRHEPHGWALPGGFVEPEESLEQAVRREVEEETGLRIERAVQMHAYSGPSRDPRFPTVSAVFVAVAHGDVAAGDDAARAGLFPLDALPEDLVFDHRQILEDFRAGLHGLEPGHLH